MKAFPVVHIIVAAILVFCLAVTLPARADTTYDYIGPTFTVAVNEGAPDDCGQPLANLEALCQEPPTSPDYDYTMRITGSFTVSDEAGCVPPSWSNVCVVSYSFTDGRMLFSFPDEEGLLNHEVVSFYMRIWGPPTYGGSTAENPIDRWTIHLRYYPPALEPRMLNMGVQQYHFGTYLDRYDHKDWVQLSECILPAAERGCTGFGTDRASVYRFWPNQPDPGNYPFGWWRRAGSVDTPPTADAGSPQNIRYLPELVELDGTGSDDDNTPKELLLYQWLFESLPEGSTAALTAPETPTPSFTADVIGTYVISLQVTDNEGQSDTDSVEVSTENLAPTAEAGESDIVFVGHSVSLDGSLSSDPEDYEPLAYEWTMLDKPDGSIAALALYDTAIPSFTPDLEGLYTAELIVRDDLGPSLSDTVVITAVLPETFAEGEVVDTAEFVDDLSNALVTTKGNKQALLNFLSQALIAIQIGDIEEAIKKLEDAISRTDGCMLRGDPDGNGKGRDWITDCSAQFEVYDKLNGALDAISP